MTFYRRSHFLPFSFKHNGNATSFFIYKRDWPERFLATFLQCIKDHSGANKVQIPYGQIPKIKYSSFLPLKCEEPDITLDLSISTVRKPSLYKSFIEGW